MSNRELIDRLRGKYPVGPVSENGEPEFGNREFPVSAIQLEAADALEAMEKTPKEQTAAEIFAHGLGQLPKLADAAGCYVEIKVTEAKDAPLPAPPEDKS